MSDPRFFKRQGPFSATELASRVGAELGGKGNGDVLIEDVAALDMAGPGHLSFLDNRKYTDLLPVTKAAAVVLHPDHEEALPEGCVGILSPQPYRTFALISGLFYPAPEAVAGISPSASVSESASVHPGAEIAAGSVICERAVIGDGAIIGPNAVIDVGVTIGARTRIGAGAYVGFSDIGDDCHIHPGVRIGTRGFGFAMDPRGHVDVPQTGRVIVGDHVEIGANTTVDRGMGPDTVIGSGTKIDNLVQIGHNVQIGRGCVIVALCGIAGSTVLEDFVVCAAQVGIAGHLRIGKGAQIAAKSGITRNVKPGEKVGGIPAVPLKQWLRQHAILSRLARQKSAEE